MKIKFILGAMLVVGAVSYSAEATDNWFYYIIFLKQFQENKKAIHPLLIKVEAFLLRFVKNSNKVLW